jgi:hypothetical protein
MALVVFVSYHLYPLCALVARLTVWEKSERNHVAVLVVLVLA